MIRRHLTHGCSRWPESVFKQALHALDEREAEAAQHEEAGMNAQKAAQQPGQPVLPASVSTYGLST